MQQVHQESGVGVRRLARALGEPVSTAGRWLKSKAAGPVDRPRRCPVSGDPELRAKVRQLCQEPRNRTFGYRRIRALLRRRWKIRASRRTVCRILREEGLKRPKVWHRKQRPARVEKMKPSAPNRAWQIDMTSFQLSDLSGVFLVTVVDCYTRQIVGWTLDRRCRASEWVSAVRMALESRGLQTREACQALTLRSDNGAQPCSKAFVEYLGSQGVQGQYTGYNAPDDNAYVERVMRTLKEEEIWSNLYETFSEAHLAIETYVRYYNQERIHSALDYQTPDEMLAAYITLVAA